MENKLTKKRLSAFLSYEWIILIIAIVVSIIVWELIFTVSAVRLTSGQSFKFYYDENVDSRGIGDLYSYMQDNNVLSYDVLDFESESLTSDYNVLSVRLSVYEGDLIFTDKVINEGKDVRVNSLIDSYGYSLTELYSDAVNYLNQFLIDGQTDSLNFDNLSAEKIKNNFELRAKKRVYKNAIKDGTISINDELDRIKKLCQDVKDFETILNSNNSELFYKYTRYAQSVQSSDDYKSVYETQLANNPDAIYGLNVGALKDGKRDITEFVKISQNDSAEDVVLIVFNFKSEQPDLQYETISFIVGLVKECSNILG